MRTIIIGDIHGCSRALNVLLARINPVPGKDRLIFLGDLFGIGHMNIRCVMLFVLFAIATEPAMRYLGRLFDLLEMKIEEMTDRYRRGGQEDEYSFEE